MSCEPRAERAGHRPNRAPFHYSPHSSQLTALIVHIAHIANAQMAPTAHTLPDTPPSLHLSADHP